MSRLPQVKAGANEHAVVHLDDGQSGWRRTAGQRGVQGAVDRGPGSWSGQTTVGDTAACPRPGHRPHGHQGEVVSAADCRRSLITCVLCLMYAADSCSLGVVHE